MCGFFLPVFVSEETDFVIYVMVIYVDKSMFA
nr:MAG TPA: hypothetical protein [Caudoviricetes sp.]